MIVLNPKTGKVVISSAWSYEARHLAKKVLKEYFPTGYQEAYDAMVGVMKLKLYELPSSSMPSAIRWIDGRALVITVDQASHSLNISLSAPNDKECYQEYMAGPGVGKGIYRTKHGIYTDVEALYELNKG